MSAPFPTVVIENLLPKISDQIFPIKRIVGDVVTVEASIYKEGHDVIRAVLKWRPAGASFWHEVPMKPRENYRWEGSFPATDIGFTEYTIEAWGDVFESWIDEVAKKLDANLLNLSTEALEGAAHLRAIATRISKKNDSKKLLKIASQLEKKRENRFFLQTLISNQELLKLANQYPDRSWATLHDPIQKVRIDRSRANFSAWYEFFPRSAEGKEDEGSRFRDCLERIDDAKAMGFDVIYFPPIHPIGVTSRKGKNNSLECLPKDPGVPYATGSSAGGHYAIEPELGTLKDFEWLIKEIQARGMELALDFALNCSPDHPYVKEHPEWFFHRPDGSIKYAENPPKKYQDVYPLNFQTSSWRLLWDELRDVLIFWAKKGIRIFRVDNPHTKPVAFWEWIIAEVQTQFPDVIFLSEAFTHPGMMKRLAKVGFTQSYTYFTWRNTREELEEYFRELTQTEMKEYFRPHLFTNTPDILPFYLQQGGRPAFLIRALLAATLSPLYGIYSGFELCENTPLSGREEYADSEKYQFKRRDWNAPGNIKSWITRLNEIRKTNPALQTLHGLKFCGSDNPSIIFYLKKSEDESNLLLIAVNLDPYHTQSGVVEVPIKDLGLQQESSYQVEDLLTGQSYEWRGASNFVLLQPERYPAHILRVKHGG